MCVPMRLWFRGEESGCWGLSFTYSSEGIHPKLLGDRRAWGDGPSPLGCGTLCVREGDTHREALPSRLLTAEWGGAVERSVLLEPSSSYPKLPHSDPGPSLSLSP